MDKNVAAKKVKYYLDKDSSFVIENFNLARPFANFFPGIAGKYGIPMWAFYVNRGQAISGFGVKDKDHSIMEFFPANKAWRFTSSLGFRTLIKIKKHGKDVLFYEPFHNGFVNLGFKTNNRMIISPSSLTLEETNTSLGINIKVEYFTIPQDSFAGLARIVTLANLSSKKLELDIIDGLPQIIPFGISNLFLKKLGRTIEAWVKIENLENNVPFYKLDVDPTDRPEVIHIHEGNFYLGFHYESSKAKIIRPLVDPQSVFGQVTDFSLPAEFLKNNFSAPKKETFESKTPSALLALDLKLSGKEKKSFYAVCGYMRNIQTLRAATGRITEPGYLRNKQAQNKQLIEGITEAMRTESSSRELNLYARQNYLDNIMRGGLPLVYPSEPQRTIFYLYSRKHGDLERDYNKFQLQPTYFSQGNGNYRDMNQNRRCDVWFNPLIEDENLVDFLNLIQADGFNPLVVKGATFSIRSGVDLKDILETLVNETGIDQISGYLNKPFTPGELILFIEEERIKLKVSYDEFLTRIFSFCEKNHEAEHGEGFWIDHWTYNLDLIESYLAIYPEKLNELIFQKSVFTFFDNSETVKPRSEKFLLKDGVVRQLHSLHADGAKKEMQRKRLTQPHVVRSQYGCGQIYKTTLINKLLCLLSNKLSSLDPFGIGVEMEADKPNWFDALNGLPGLLGSSLCETIELKRLILFIRKALAEANPDSIAVTEEILVFLKGLNATLKVYFEDNSDEKEYRFWDRSHLLKEEYRHKTRLGFEGREIELNYPELLDILDSALKKIEGAIENGKSGSIYHPYFINEVVEYEVIKDSLVRPLKFRQKRLPIYLESQMHALRIAPETKEALSIYKATKASPLYDKKLKMYKVTSDLSGMPEEIGRCRVFPRGWLEHESVWLHMEYKYLLELLKQGLNEEFFSEFRNTVIAFQKPQRYGRSILENSSFLVSSAFKDKNLHGNGYVARLSGSTVEFINIWLVMNVGKQPFSINEKKELNLKFTPTLAGWLFDPKSKSYAFNFLGKIRVVYHNPKRRNTFGRDAAKITRMVLSDKNGRIVEIFSDTIPSPIAEQIRDLGFKQIDIYLE